MRPNHKSIAKLTAVALTVISTSAFASGFQSFEQSASGLGTAYAGSAARANDAATEFTNPAGMTRLDHAVVAVSGVVVAAHSDFTPSFASNQFGPGPIFQIPNSNTENILGPNPLPALHIVAPIIPHKLAFGFGITVPFGLETDYGKSSSARYLATESKLQVINFNPSIAYQVTKQLSLGLGFDVQYMKANLDQQYDAAGFVDIGSPSLDTDGSVNVEASDWGIGWNAGILYQFSPHTRAGLAYRSSVHHHLTGDVNVTIPGALAPNDIDSLKSIGFVNGDASSSLTLPATTTLSLYHDINNVVSVMGSITYTQWDSIQDLVIDSSSNLGNQSGTGSKTVIHENFRNTWHAAIGATFQATQKLKLRTGVAYDETPVQDEFRTARLPDSDRYWFAFGAGYQVNKHLTADIGYAHVFIKNANINEFQPLSPATPTTVFKLEGSYHNNYANLFGAQLSWHFV